MVDLVGWFESCVDWREIVVSVAQEFCDISALGGFLRFGDKINWNMEFGIF